MTKKPHKIYIRGVGGEEGLCLAIIASARDLWLHGTYTEWWEAYQFFLSDNYRLFIAYLKLSMSADIPLYPDSVNLQDAIRGYAYIRRKGGMIPIWD